MKRSGITVEESAYEHHLDSGVETEDLSTTTSGSSSTASFSRSGSMDSLLSDDDEDDNRLSSFSSKTRRHHNANSSSSGATDVNSNGDDGDGLRYAVLCHEQVRRLDRVMHEVIPIDGRGNFPTLEIQLRDLVQLVRAKLERDDIHVRDIRLNGGCASYVLSSDDSQPYNDLDLIFAVDLSSHKNYEKVKQAVLSSLLDFMPEKVNKKRITSCSLKEAYVHKMVKVPSEGDRWSLISLSNSLGRNIELKFVDTMKRQFEFSVDSFQIILDSLLLFHECAAMPMSETFYPSVVGESVYGNFQEALYHLNCKLISTRHPEEIRGGGLLKYCDLLVRDYQAANVDEIKTLERYMCSRFFIDFSDINHQRTKLENYLVNHFIGGDELSKYDYLTTLHRVVNDSTVCLMGHERRQTLSLIEELACRVYFQEQQMVMSKQPFQFQQFELVSVGHPSSGSSNGANGSYTTTNQPIQFIFGAQPNNGSQPAAGYFVTPFMTSPMPSNQQTFQQQQQQQPCTCSWMPCT